MTERENRGRKCIFGNTIDVDCMVRNAADRGEIADGGVSSLAGRNDDLIAASAPPRRSCSSVVNNRITK